MPAENDVAGTPADADPPGGEARAPYDPWAPPAWYQTLAHEHAEHLVTLLELGRGIRGAARTALGRHIDLESARYVDVLRRQAAAADPADRDTAYHVERLLQHVVLTRSFLQSDEIRPDLLVDLLHHFAEEQASYLDPEARESLLDAVETAVERAQWTVGPLMKTR